jgi:hypothetical protein
VIVLLQRAASRSSLVVARSYVVGARSAAVILDVHKGFWPCRHRKRRVRQPRDASDWYCERSIQGLTVSIGDNAVSAHTSLRGSGSSEDQKAAAAYWDAAQAILRRAPNARGPPTNQQRERPFPCPKGVPSRAHDLAVNCHCRIMGIVVNQCERPNVNERHFFPSGVRFLLARLARYRATLRLTVSDAIESRSRPLKTDFTAITSLTEISRSPVAACEPNPPQPLPWCPFFPNA